MWHSVGQFALLESEPLDGALAYEKHSTCRHLLAWLLAWRAFWAQTLRLTFAPNGHVHHNRTA